ncbi:hypothetical protein SAMN05216168_4499 [Kosakonia radicincitans]|uniref:gp53-like domain-containing protein n=1 Tax=Kosakonia radicincitans TaxID=283686 RepID=UPI0009C24BED|nr:hypothetical protein [Kosakonia radicincitans]SKC22464.1 hypothetical protein SAMN05216168_4499 [Kosakonia radicincitans]
MHRIDTATAQVDKFGVGKNGFTAGNPQSGTPATDLDNDYFDMLQEELAKVVESTGVELDKEKHDQLLTALKYLFQSKDATLTAIAALVTSADKLLYFTGVDTVAQTALTDIGRNVLSQTSIANLLTYLTLGTAAQRNVGTGTNQLPDMSSFAGVFANQGYQRLPGNLIFQWGAIPAQAMTNGQTGTQTFQITFPNACFQVIVGSTAGTIGTTSEEGFFCASRNTTGFNWTSAWQSRTASLGEIPYFAIGN